jgi:hypothetical protein
VFFLRIRVSIVIRLLRQLKFVVRLRPSAATGRCFLKKDSSAQAQTSPHALADEQIRRLLGCVKNPVNRTSLTLRSISKSLPRRKP